MPIKYQVDNMFKFICFDKKNFYLDANSKELYS